MQFVVCGLWFAVFGVWIVGCGFIFIFYGIFVVCCLQVCLVLAMVCGLRLVVGVGGAAFLLPKKGGS